MLDKALVDFARQYNLKLTEDSTFGYYRGQLFNLGLLQNNQYNLIVSFSPEKKELFQLLSTKENKKKISSLVKCMSVQIHERAIILQAFISGF